MGSVSKAQAMRERYMRSKEVKKKSVYRDFRVRCKVITGVACLLRSGSKFDVSIPRIVANKTKIPTIINGIVTNVPVSDGMRAILSRSPVITHQSLISVTIRITDDPMMQTVIGVGPLVIDKQGGDFDGDPVSLCIPTSQDAINELETMRNFYIRNVPYPKSLC